MCFTYLMQLLYSLINVLFSLTLPEVFRVEELPLHPAGPVVARLLQAVRTAP